MSPDGGTAGAEYLHGALDDTRRSVIRSPDNGDTRVANRADVENPSTSEGVSAAGVDIGSGVLGIQVHERRAVHGTLARTTPWFEAAIAVITLTDERNSVGDAPDAAALRTHRTGPGKHIDLIGID